MKRTVWGLLLLLFVSSCSHNERVVRDTLAFVGYDKDVHGCVVSAGEVWCSLLGRCIRPFDLGLKLVDDGQDGYVKAAYAVFNQDSSKVQLFIYNRGKDIILERFSEHSDTLWLDKTGKTKCRFSYTRDKSFIMKNNRILYRLSR